MIDITWFYGLFAYEDDTMRQDLYFARLFDQVSAK